MKNIKLNMMLAASKRASWQTGRQAGKQHNFPSFHSFKLSIDLDINKHKRIVYKKNKNQNPSIM